MDLSSFIAIVLGIYLLIFVGIWLLKRESVNQSIKDLASSKGLLLMAGEFNILAGLAILIGHPIWELNWMGLITLLGLLMFIKGIIYVVRPEEIQKQVPIVIEKHYWIYIGVYLVLGVFLTYSGFAHL